MSEKLDLITHTRRSVKDYLRHMDEYETRDLYDAVVYEIEKGLILEVLDHCDGNQSETSKILGITRTTLRNKIRKHKLSPKG